VMEKIGKLCDYVLWDEAWIGYNAFHPLFEDHSPMRIETLSPDLDCFRRNPSTSKGQDSRRHHKFTSATSTFVGSGVTSSTSGSMSRSS